MTQTSLRFALAHEHTSATRKTRVSDLRLSALPRRRWTSGASPIGG